MTSFHPASDLNRSSFSPNAAKAAGFRVSGVHDGSGAAGPLGTNAKFSPTSESDSGKKQAYNPRAARAERYRLQKKAQEILWKKGVSEGLKYPANYHKTTKCLRVAVADKVDIHRSATTGKAFYGGGLVVCGKPGCPVCSAKIQERRRVEIAKCFDWAYSQGKKIVMVTFTFPHGYEDGLKELMTKQAGALTRLRKGRSWDLFKNRIGFDGLIRSLEVTHGANGWHPHTHEAWVVDANADVKKITEFVTEQWLSACKKEGLVPHGKVGAFRKHAVDVQDNCRASDYFAKQDQTVTWGADRELAKSSTKKGKKSGKSPFQLLELAADGDERAADLYLEYTQAIKGKSVIRWSQGLKGRVGVDELTDEELARREDDKADLLALLTLEEWSCVIAHDARAYVLDLAEEKGLTGIKRWILAPFIP